MKRCLLLLVLMAAFQVPGATPREAEWNAVAEAQSRGLPQTALERLQPILDAAIREAAWAEAAKAIGRKIALEAEIQGNLPQERVTRFSTALAEAPPALAPIFHTLLAHAYWSYFQQNRWRIQQRTATSGEPGGDFETWDLRTLFAGIDRQFMLSLTNDAALKSIPISDFNVLLEPGTVPDRYRPTLYDFLAYQALDFFSAGEQAGARPQDAFVVEATSPALSDSEVFLAWNPEISDTNAVAFRAIRLYQDLLRFHARDEDPSAFHDADLHRLRYMGNVAVGPAKDERLLAALRSLAQRAASHEISSLARYEQARILQRQGKLDVAHAVAAEAGRTFPDSLGAKLSRNLVRELETPSARLTTEHIWNDPWPTLDVTHRNITRLWFRAVEVDWNVFLERRNPRPGTLSRDEQLGLIGRRPALAWTVDLPATPDFQERLTQLPAPTTLRPGFYFILASHQENFGEAGNEVTLTPIWVSELALVVRTRAGQWEGWVLEAKTGLPVPGARVEAWYLNQRGERIAAPSRTTDAAGTFAYERPSETRGYLFKATHGTRTVALGHDLWWGGDPMPVDREERTVFFTDRAIYRPGQLIQYKGVCLAADPARSKYEPIVDRGVIVVLRDMNGREIARAPHRANDFGSFSGSFTAPADGVTGWLQILVEGTPEGATSVQVEEYKRPKFHVAIDAPAQAPRLNERVNVTGRALAYTGAAIDGAQVTWRVVRQVRFPPWLTGFRGYWPAHSDSQEIAHGTARTRTDGSFSLEFQAVPDAAVAEADEPVFEYHVHADVTDNTGETRSDHRKVNIGYTALAADLSVADWQTSADPIAIAVSTRSLDDDGASASGTLRVHRLRQPDRVHRARLDNAQHFVPGRTNQPPDLSNPDHWELGEIAAEQAFQTPADGTVTNRFSLAPGAYRVVLTTQDRLGKAVTAQAPLLVINPEADRFALPVPSRVIARAWEVEPGEEFLAVWGTGYDSGRAFVEIEREHRLIQRFWTEPTRTQQAIRIPVTEALRGGFTLHVTYVRENRSYTESRRVEVPWINKEFELTWGTFRSKLEPGQKETWTATVKPRRPGSSGEKVAAEMVATLYDASLDQFLPLNWPRQFDCFPTDESNASTFFSNNAQWFEHLRGHIDMRAEQVEIRYRQFPPDFIQPARFMAFRMQRGAMMTTGSLASPAALSAMTPVLMSRAPGAVAEAADAAALGKAGEGGGGSSAPPAGGTGPDPSAVTARKNLQETAFFLPHLLTDSNGVVQMTFTLPEALTEWRFLGFAHDRQLRSGRLEGKTVTSRDLMIQPNPPRFLREGDQIEFTAKVSNQSAERLSGRARLALSFTLDGAAADEALGNTQPEVAFEIPSKESRVCIWRLTVPDGSGFLTFKVTAATDRLSDGEEGILPVLSRRVFLTESLPLPIRGPGARKFTFEHLRDATNSPTLRHAGLTVQMVSNPAWYAVLALPYLMEAPHECSEQVFHRLYANALARHIANSDPRIEAVFAQWRGTEALKSPLQQNAELKSIVLEETPWLREARDETEARRNVAMLFQGNRLNHEQERSLRQLGEMQLVDGGWPWFPGGPRDEFITLYIVTGFGRLRHLGVEVPVDAALNAVQGLDAWMHRRWEQLRDDKNLDRPNLDPTTALYLYGRSFFLADRPVSDAYRASFDYWTAQARKHWLELKHRQPLGHLALALHRLGPAQSPENSGTANAIVQSLREHAVRNDEMGMFWREDERSWWWYRAPIETQALMIEVFHEIASDEAAVEALKVWLLKQKQTQNWKTTKATADAVYALLLRGPSLLTSDRLVQVQVGGRSITPNQRAASVDPSSTTPEAGTGFYQVRFPAAEVSSKLAEITLNKPDSGVAWGSVHWQYFEDVSRVKAYDGTPLKLTKALFTRVNTRTGQQLVPVQDRNPVKVGDELVVRVELRVDRDMEYVHLKDQRGSGTEPVNVLSTQRFQDGLSYYESTRDTASHFFIGYLPKGTYVFEYPLRVQHRGEYPTGFASVECLYAPEFNSHSASLPLRAE